MLRVNNKVSVFRPKALFFDVGGTIFDWKKSIADSLDRSVPEELSAEEVYRFADRWRTGMFKQRSLVADGHLPWMNSDQMHLEALINLQNDFAFIDALDDKNKFVERVWHNLVPFDGANDALIRLRQRYTTLVLTILSWESIVKSSKRAGIVWDGILSCEFLGYYKPSLQAYITGARYFGVAPEDAMMVAAHESDLIAAKRAGLQTAHVKLPFEDDIFKVGNISEDDNKFDLRVSSFDELCEQLEIA